MRRRVAIVTAAMAGMLAFAPVSYGHPFNPPEGGIGDTPMNSEQGRAHGGDNYDAALAHSEAENSLFRNPTCGAHNDHPPGNP